jgi:lipoyl-dependent peroxiredoxin
MAVERKGSVVWEGDLASGRGQASLDSSGLGGSLPMSWPKRAEEQEAAGQSSPEELLAAAHATCFSMALSKALADAGHPPERLETSETATFDTTGGPHVSHIALSVRGTVPGIDDAGFNDAADAAKDGCPVSKALAGNVEITVEASLAS